jgi:hypothetical protein
MRGRKLKAHIVGPLLGVVAAAGLAVTGAQAHGPSRQKVTESIEINAPAAQVWKLIGNFQDLSWMPEVAKTTGTGGNEPNTATRVVTLTSGATIAQDLTRYDKDEMVYGYFTDKIDVKVLPVNDYSGSIQVQADGNKSKVTWEAAFYRGYMNNDPPPNLNDDAAMKAVTNLIQTDLAALKKKVEATH